MEFLAVRCVLPFAGETSSKHTLLVSNLVVQRYNLTYYICTTTNLDHGAPRKLRSWGHFSFQKRKQASQRFC
jgi:hypothetical protein